MMVMKALLLSRRKDDTDYKLMVSKHFVRDIFSSVWGAKIYVICVAAEQKVRGRMGNDLRSEFSLSNLPISHT